MISRSVNTKPKSTLDDPVVSRYLDDLHDHFVIVPEDKAPNNVVFICKAFYYSCLRTELDDSDNRNASSTYQRTNLNNEILINHRSVLSLFGVNTKDDIDLPSLYWTPKLHKNPYKQRFIAGSSSCFTKPLSKLLTSILTTVKDGL